MRFWGIMIIALGSLAIYEDLAVKLARICQETGIVSAEMNDVVYIESVRIWAFVLLLLFMTVFTILYYRKHHEFFWNDIINP